MLIVYFFYYSFTSCSFALVTSFMFNVFLSSFLIIPFSPLLFLESILFLFPVFVVGLVCGFRRKTNILSLTTLLRPAMFKTTARPFPRSSVSCLYEPTGGVLPPSLLVERSEGPWGSFQMKSIDVLTQARHAPGLFINVTGSMESSQFRTRSTVSRQLKHQAP